MEDKKDPFILHSQYHDLVMQEGKASAAMILTYRKISNIRRTKSSNLNVSRLVLQLSEASC